MDQQAALQRLDLPAGSEADDVLRVYQARSRLLKHLILSSTKASEKEDYRSNLRILIQCRDAALNGHRPIAREAVPSKLSGRPLIESLNSTSLSTLDRSDAREFLGLREDDGAEAIDRSYAVRQRTLIRQFARARTDKEMAEIRRARNKLRTIRNLAF